MKKIYTFLAAIAVSVTLNAQIELEVTLDNYTAGSTVSDDPLNMDFTITNYGPTINQGDTLVMSYIFNGANHTISTLQAGFVSIFILQADMLNGDAINFTTTNLSMQTIYDTLSPNNEGITQGDFCIAVPGVGLAALQPGGNNLHPNNVACVTYVVTSVVGVEENTSSKISAYPNPVADILTIDLGDAKANYINILDMSGRIVKTINVNNQKEIIQVSDFDNGVYFYQVVSEGAIVKTEKFIVSK